MSNMAEATASSSPTHPGGETTEDRTTMISARLKQLYKKAILPVEKKYRYDYFFESPLLSDVEFDGTCVHTLLKLL
jgi:N-terminal EH-domain containing protein